MSLRFALDCQIALSLTGFKCDEVSSGIDYKYGTGTIKLQLQGTRLMAVGNMYLIKKRNPQLSSIDDIIHYMEDVPW